MKKSSKNIICSITQLDSNEQKRLLHLFARLNEQLRVEILDSQKDTFHKLKFNYIEVENKKLSYCAFVLSIKEFQNNVNLDE